MDVLQVTRCAEGRQRSVSHEAIRVKVGDREPYNAGVRILCAYLMQHDGAPKDIRALARAVMEMQSVPVIDVPDIKSVRACNRTDLAKAARAML